MIRTGRYASGGPDDLAYVFLMIGRELTYNSVSGAVRGWAVSAADENGRFELGVYENDVVRARQAHIDDVDLLPDDQPRPAGYAAVTIEVEPGSAWLSLRLTDEQIGEMIAIAKTEQISLSEALSRAITAFASK